MPRAQIQNSSAAQACQGCTPDSPLIIHNNTTSNKHSWCRFQPYNLFETINFAQSDKHLQIVATTAEHHHLQSCCIHIAIAPDAVAGIRKTFHATSDVQDYSAAGALPTQFPPSPPAPPLQVSQAADPWALAGCCMCACPPEARSAGSYRFLASNHILGT